MRFFLFLAAAWFLVSCGAEQPASTSPTEEGGATIKDGEVLASGRSG